LHSHRRSSDGHGHISCKPGLGPGNVRIGRVCRSVRARHLRQHPSNGRIMKRGHPGDPQATRMKSSVGSSKRDQYRAQKLEKCASWQPFTSGGGRLHAGDDHRSALLTPRGWGVLQRSGHDASSQGGFAKVTAMLPSGKTAPAHMSSLSRSRCSNWRGRDVATPCKSLQAGFVAVTFPSGKAGTSSNGQPFKFGALRLVQSLTWW
jgi:hypothetical protein